MKIPMLITIRKAHVIFTTGFLYMQIHYNNTLVKT